MVTMNSSICHCGNIVIATLLCLNITFLSAAGAPIANTNKDRHNTFSYKDKSFNSSFIVENRTVKCSGLGIESHYPTPMYTCQGMSVDEDLLYHGYITEGTGSKLQQCPSGCPCGTNRGRINNIQALCAAMLEAHNVNESLVAAYVVKPHCDSQSTSLAKRVKFYLNKKGEGAWEEVYTENGYITTLQCLTELPKS